ncbi:hypothetical protein ES705_29977 [subsurface metagenome]
MAWDEVEAELEGLSEAQLKLLLRLVVSWLSEAQEELLLRLVGQIRLVNEEDKRG